MRATSWNWSTRRDEGRPTAGEVTRARVCAAAMGVVVLIPLLVGWSAGVRGGSSPSPSGASTLAEHPAPAPAGGESLGHLDEAIEMRSVSRAVYEWRNAYGEALRSRDWKALLAAGDRAARVDGLRPQSGPFREEARRAYLAALFRARSEGSTVGVLGAADGFRRLGDAEAASAAGRLVAELASAR